MTNLNQELVEEIKTSTIVFKENTQKHTNQLLQGDITAFKNLLHEHAP